MLRLFKMPPPIFSFPFQNSPNTLTSSQTFFHFTHIYIPSSAPSFFYFFTSFPLSFISPFFHFFTICLSACQTILFLCNTKLNTTRVGRGRGLAKHEVSHIFLVVSSFDFDLPWSRSLVPHQ